MINTFLFDLDGTLLPLDMERFLQIYFDEMAKKLYKVVDPELTPNIYGGHRIYDTEY